MKSVSVKELRQDLPQILKGLEKGDEYLLVYHSKPVGEILPLRKRRSLRHPKTLYDLLKTPFGEVLFPEGQSAVDLIRADRDS